MYPVLFELGRFPIYAYGLLLAAAYLLGLQLAVRRARARGLDGARVIDLGIWVIISALVGAKLLLLAVDFDRFRANPSELLSLVRSGGVFYGGLALAVPVALLYARRAGLPIWTTSDAFAPGIALGHVIGRLGCLMAGCCYGRPADVPWASHVHQPRGNRQCRYPAGSAAAPDAALRGRSRAVDPRSARGVRAPRPALPGPDVLGIHPPVRPLPVHRSSFIAETRAA